MKFKAKDILKTNSPSKRKVLKVFSSSYVLSKPNQLDVPDTKMLYTDDYIEWKGWKKEEMLIDTEGNRVQGQPIDWQKVREIADKILAEEKHSCAVEGCAVYQVSNFKVTQVDPNAF